MDNIDMKLTEPLRGRWVGEYMKGKTDELQTVRTKLLQTFTMA